MALLSAARLAQAPARGAPPRPDAVGSVATIVALCVGLAAFSWLGRSVAGDGAGARGAVVAGAIGGALTGLGGGAAQSVALADYLGAVLVGYAVPAEFLTIALAGYVLLATVGGAVVGGGITYLAWHRAIGTAVSRSPDTRR